MQFKIDVKSIEWWFWAITLALIVSAVAGRTSGYAAVMIVSAVHMGFIAVRTGSLVSFPAQVRIFYVALTLTGLWEAGRFYCYAFLLAGTFMVVLFDRCGLELVLRYMPWNKGKENAYCKLPEKKEEH
jgi:hypothetical protein